MSLAINRTMLAGNLTRDPQVKPLNNDNTVCNFGIAINRRFKVKGELREEVVFVDVEAWGRTAELVGQYLTKGSPVFIEGRLKLDSWEDKDGSKRSKLTVVADNVQFLGGAKPKGDDDTQELPPTQQAAVNREKAQAAGGLGGDDQPPFARSELEWLP